jgi:DNA invertase Pin-like site-specific DNA recombinase
MDKQTIVALYSRVSTRDKGQDVENQLAALREFCIKQGWIIFNEYCDRKSAKNTDRPAFQQLFTDAAQRRFDLVLFWSLDRFSREGVLGTLQLLQKLTSYGVGYRSYSEQYLDSCGLFKDAVISILATIAKQERVRLSERVHAGLARAAKAGRFPGRPPIKCDREQVLALRAAGTSLGAISRQMGITKASVYNIVRRAQCAQLQVSQ